MDGLHTFLVVLLGVVSLSPDWISGSVLEVTVRPGDNITLYCDCKTSTGVYIVWYRNCSHENQPTLVVKAGLKPESWSPTINAADYLNPLPRFHFVKNFSSKSHDLLIMNTTDSDEGLYYCGTEQMKVGDEGYVTSRHDYRYGNITTRVRINSSESSLCPDCSGFSDVSWMMIFTPAFTVLSSLVTFIYVYHLCQPSDKESQVHQNRADIRGHIRLNQDEDVYLTRAVYWAQDG